MSRRRDPGWRDRAASQLLVRHLEGLDLAGSALVMGDPLFQVQEALEARGLDSRRWNRRALGDQAASSWPAPGPFGVVTLRLPRSREELAMALHAAVSVLEPGGALFVYGAKDEGIRSALTLLQELIPESETLAVGGHSRVLGATGPQDPGSVRGTPDSWRSVVDLEYPELGRAWVSFPGVFAHGRLDAGTRLLLDALPPLPAGARVLDYGCGSGVVGAVAAARGEGLRLELLDVDALALEAARENLPHATFLLRSGLPTTGAGLYDALLTNPPFHRGKEEDPQMIRELIRGAPRLLGPNGILVFVTQRRLPVERELQASFSEVALLAENATFRVWKGVSPG